MPDEIVQHRQLDRQRGSQQIVRVEQVFEKGEACELDADPERTDYIESNPPQRDFIVELKTGDGSTVKKIVNIFDPGNQQFQFRQLRDE